MIWRFSIAAPYRNTRLLILKKRSPRLILQRLCGRKGYWGDHAPKRIRFSEFSRGGPARAHIHCKEKTHYWTSDTHAMEKVEHGRPLGKSGKRQVDTYLPGGEEIECSKILCPKHSFPHAKPLSIRAVPAHPARAPRKQGRRQRLWP